MDGCWASSGNCIEGTWSEANEKCTSEGGRLCSRSEVEGFCTTGTGCGFDFRVVWTSSTESSIAPFPEDYDARRAYISEIFSKQCLKERDALSWDNLKEVLQPGRYQYTDQGLKYKNSYLCWTMINVITNPSESTFNKLDFLLVYGY